MLGEGTAERGRLNTLSRILKHQTLGPNYQQGEMLVIFDLSSLLSSSLSFFHTPTALRWQCGFGDLKHEKEGTFSPSQMASPYYALKAYTFWSSSLLN
jgi:hypothetical protein